MLVNNISVYACKSKRDNSKCDTIHIKSYRNNDNTLINNIKGCFKDDDIADIKDFLKRTEYKGCYRLVVYNGTVNLRNWKSGYFVDEESLLRTLNTFKDLLNR